MFDELTEIDIKKMQEEIEYRKSLREALSEDVRIAKSDGDLSENAGYHDAKRDKNKNEGRINYLKKMIETATIITTNPDKDSIGIFDKVDVFFEDEQETETITLSTATRIDVARKIINKDSPLGKAIYGHKVGDRIFVNVSDDCQYYVVIKKIVKGEDDSSVPLNKY